IGSILCHYILERLSSREGALPQRPVIIKTIVTTELQRAIADSFGAAVIDVLTGFKYIGEQIRLLEEAGGAEGEFVFGGEESYGYLAGTHARDKDAVVSSQLIAEVAAWCAWHDKTMGDYLDDIFRRYGVYLESLRSLTRKGKKGSEEISALMERFRECTPESISGSRVVGCWDLATGEKVDLETETVEKTSLPSANVLVFYLDDKSKVTMRPSGTEPKIKFYFGVVGSCDEEKPLEEIKKESFARLAKLEEDFMEMVERALA
ncbi:MAG: phospho-sugar mutase, partial [Gemmatimonadota bacterium]|nr:phospho-sugar mutase [Gemmatimonadota bacterium]